MGNAILFADNKSDKSVIKSLVRKKEGAKTVSGNNRKANNDDDNNDDGKNQKDDNKE